jgi:hypothetical protein
VRGKRDELEATSLQGSIDFLPTMRLTSAIEYPTQGDECTRLLMVKIP